MGEISVPVGALEHVLARVSDGIVALDRAWRYTYINEQAAALFGRTPADLIGKHIWTEFPEGVGQPFHRNYERALAEQQPISFEDHYAPWDRWFENRVYPSDDGITIFFHEITDRKRAELARQTADNLNRLIIESAHEGIAVFDRERRYVQVNAALARMMEAEPAAVIGRRPSECLPAAPARNIEARLGRALNGELVEEHELPVPRLRSGDPAWVSSVLVPMRSVGGEVLGVLAFIRDDTERVATARALRDGEQRLRLALVAAGAGVWDWDLTTQRIVWSPEHERLWGLPVGSFRGTYEEFVAPLHPGDRAELEATVAASKRTGTPYRAEFRLLTGAGVERWIAAFGHAICDEAGRAVRMLGTVVDITERKRAELRLSAQSRILEMVANGEPLSSVLEAIGACIEEQMPGVQCAVLLLDDARRRVQHAAAPSLPRELVGAFDGQAIGPDAGSCGVAAFFGLPVYTEDILTDPHWDRYRAAVAPHGLRACWSTPLFDRQHAVRGTFALYRRQPGLPEDWQVELVAASTHIAEVAIASADEQLERTRAALRDLERQRHAADELRQLSARLLRTQDDERRRIARELHDTTGQNLAALSINLDILATRVGPGEAAQLVTESAELVRLSADELRTLSYLLHPPLLEDFGLERALRDLVVGFSRRSGIETTCDLAPIGRMSRDRELALFRVAQEALTNVRRHSGSSRAHVALRLDGARMVLEITDQGRNATAAEHAVGVGIAGMRERLRQLGGELEVSFGPAGTQVTAMAPTHEAP